MKLRIRYFASLRELLGSAETLELPDGVDVAAARDALIALDERHAAALARTRAVRCALDLVLCDEAAPLHDDAELAFFPPVTGG
jgi:molybdopterin synthase sulfur carrier subunit